MFLPVNSPCGSVSSGGVAAFLDAVVAAENVGVFGRQEVEDFAGGPDVEGPLGVFGLAVLEEAVGVLGGIETTERVGHVAEDVVEGFACDVFVEGFVGELPGFDVGDGELGLIVEHFSKCGTCQYSSTE